MPRKRIKASEKKATMGGFSIEVGLQERFSDRCDELGLDRNAIISDFMRKWLNEHNTLGEIKEYKTKIELYESKIKELETILKKENDAIFSQIIDDVDRNLQKYEEASKTNPKDVPTPRKLLSSLMGRINEYYYPQFNGVDFSLEIRQVTKKRLDVALSDEAIKSKFKEAMGDIEAGIFREAAAEDVLVKDVAAGQEQQI